MEYKARTFTWQVNGVDFEDNKCSILYKGSWYCVYAFAEQNLKVIKFAHKQAEVDISTNSGIKWYRGNPTICTCPIKVHRITGH